MVRIANTDKLHIRASDQINETYTLKTDYVQMEWLETSSFHQAWRAHTSRGFFRISFVHMARLLLQARVLTSFFCPFSQPCPATSTSSSTSCPSSFNPSWATATGEWRKCVIRSKAFLKVSCGDFDSRHFGKNTDTGGKPLCVAGKTCLMLS